MSFAEYPRQMTHPSSRPAVCSTVFPINYRAQPGEVENPGKPATLPPVTVNNEDQEASYVAKGYVSQGGDGGEPCAEPQGYAFNEYPKWVSMHDEQVLVTSKEEEAELMAYNPPAAPTAIAAPTAPSVVKNKGGRPKGSGKPKTDKMVVVE